MRHFAIVLSAGTRYFRRFISIFVIRTIPPLTENVFVSSVRYGPALSWLL